MVMLITFCVKLLIISDDVSYLHFDVDNFR